MHVRATSFRGVRYGLALALIGAAVSAQQNAAMKEVPLSTSICSDPRYIEERLRRIALTGIPQAEADRVKQPCGRVPPTK